MEVFPTSEKQRCYNIRKITSLQRHGKDVFPTSLCDVIVIGHLLVGYGRFSNVRKTTLLQRHEKDVTTTSWKRCLSSVICATLVIGHL